jgi:hypothetical protein
VRLSQESNHHLKFIIGKGVTYIVSNVESWVVWCHRATPWFWEPAWHKTPGETLGCKDASSKCCLRLPACCIWCCAVGRLTTFCNIKDWSSHSCTQWNSWVWHILFGELQKRMTVEASTWCGTRQFSWGQ